MTTYVEMNAWLAEYLDDTNAATITWSDKGKYGQYRYAATFVRDKLRWYISGPADYYMAREGMTTQQLADLLVNNKIETLAKAEWIMWEEPF